MNDFRTPIEPEYAELLGRTLFIFAVYEWNIVWCAEKLEQGFLDRIKGQTSATIGKWFQQIVERDRTMTQLVRERLLSIAHEFRSDVGMRNLLIHGKPCSDSEQQNALSYRDRSDVVIWSTERVRELALKFEAGSLNAHAVLHSAFGPL